MVTLPGVTIFIFDRALHGEGHDCEGKTKWQNNYMRLTS
jgi:hypothetical protein